MFESLPTRCGPCRVQHPQILVQFRLIGFPRQRSRIKIDGKIRIPPPLMQISEQSRRLPLVGIQLQGEGKLAFGLLLSALRKQSLAETSARLRQGGVARRRPAEHRLRP